MNTKNKKLIIITVAAALLVVLGIVGTVAYLSSSDSVENTFTVGKIKITLDETKVDTDGVAVTPKATVKSNQYKLRPSHTYTKDPVVHVDADSESAWVFIKVTNGIASVEDAANNIDSQIKANGWTALASVDGVYYCEYTKGQSDKDLETFSQFKIGNTVTAEQLEAVKDSKLSVVAYAIQKENLTTAANAWAALS